MQIVIDIPEEDYQSVLNGHIPFNILDALKNGTPLPKDTTNGDVIKAILNPYKIYEHEYSVHIYMTEKDFWKSEYQINCDASWWNAPYKRGEKAE